MDPSLRFGVSEKGFGVADRGFGISEKNSSKLLIIFLTYA